MRLAALALMTLTLTASAAVRVAITNQMQFSPNKVTIKLGDTVEFVNESRGTHTVTADPKLAADPANVILPAGAKAFHSGRLAPGKTFTQAFTVAGLYQYVCLPHELHGMRGQVEVRPNASEEILDAGSAEADALP